jgi:hypothetical protein
VDLQRKEIKAAPKYDASRPFEREYETRLLEHYDRRKGWGPTEVLGVGGALSR